LVPLCKKNLDVLDPNCQPKRYNILKRVPNSALWLLRFPAAGEMRLRAYLCLDTPFGYLPLPGWLVSGGDPCAEGWQVVQCVNSSITGIILNGANLGGELDENLGAFVSIIQIDLSNNHIGGHILSSLPLTIKSLMLSGNQFTRSIPDSLSLLGQMTDLHLNNNHLTGLIPYSFQQLTPLINLYVLISYILNTVATLQGHLDFSFASAWHPSGQTFVTGNQDKTCRVWDVRKLSESFMAMAEPADFVHVFDVKSGYETEQEIDFFGEISGTTFSPDAESLFI
ncbi:hypothetical protein M8C21_017788, partial [Ambrosia artemisiifolia]